MRLTIKEVNFTSSKQWIFRLQDSSGKEYFIMNSDFYRTYKLSSPISRKELDSLSKGDSVNMAVMEFMDKNIVIGE